MRERGMQPPQGGPQPNAEKKPEGEEKKPDGDKGEKKEDEIKTIKRPTEAPKAKPKELKAKPDKDGMVQFSFFGQPWTEVLQWYAEVANCSLDWQEMPADFLNLTTQRRYTIPETRDLLEQPVAVAGLHDDPAGRRVVGRQARQDRSEPRAAGRPGRPGGALAVRLRARAVQPA